ncbi:L,D-transpeptidase [Salinarimonas chemoclinalis]|uniref:L,D-transpeptidase n=1 Tax=Salinarimonas chemoclinalis TaxID=3241599 RepID=UPI003556E12C
MLTRRSLLSAAAATVAVAPSLPVLAQTTGWYTGYMPDEPYDIPFVDPRLMPAHLRLTQVVYDGPERPGTIIVDTADKHLYLVRDDGTAWRYGIGVGRDGFSWSGTARVGRKARWPGWTPPAAMRRRQPELPSHMEGGVDNPLGARALYLYEGGRDTLYRIHGTNEPWSIGEAVSSGCIRMLNQDALHLYERAEIGATVKVKQNVGGFYALAPDVEPAAPAPSRRALFTSLF